MTLKLDLENKILIPFMILVILSIASLGIVSYWNGYQLLLDNQKRYMEENIKETMYFIKNINEEVNTGRISLERAKKEVIAYYEELEQPGLVIIENKGILLSHFNRADILMKNIEEERSQGYNKIIEKDHMLFTYTAYIPWGWTLGYAINKSIFSEELIGTQKYTLLVTIISLVISMQATILIAYNISKPIKLLADVCNRIARGNLKEKIYIKRTDEIGMLADSFNNMIEKLQLNTAKLVEIMQFNEDILRNVSTGIITVDEDGNIVSMNQPAERMLKCQMRNHEENQDIEETLIKQLKETLMLGKNINNIYVFQKGFPNDKIYIDVTTSLLRTQEQKVSGAICNFNDITERRKIETEIERVNRLTSVGQLAAGLAHEIRNPLAGMKMSVQVLKKRLCTSEEEVNQDLFNGVLYEIDRLNNLITELLDFAKPRIPKYEIVDITEILNRSLHLIKKEASEKQIKINKIINAKEIYVLIDKGQIEQVFLNIVTNALRAMEMDGILNIKLDNILSEKGKFVTIEFQDNGCGISAEDMEKIFNPFFTTYPQGVGLGLSVVHKLIVENHGEIEVESVLNRGTTFKIRFPIDGGDANEEAHTHYR